MSTVTSSRVVVDDELTPLYTFTAADTVVEVTVNSPSVRTVGIGGAGVTAANSYRLRPGVSVRFTPTSGFVLNAINGNATRPAVVDVIVQNGV